MHAMLINEVIQVHTKSNSWSESTKSNASNQGVITPWSKKTNEACTVFVTLGSVLSQRIISFLIMLLFEVVCS